MLKPPGETELAELLAVAADDREPASETEAVAAAAADEEAADDGTAATVGKTCGRISGYLILRSMSRSSPRYRVGWSKVRWPTVEADALAAAAAAAVAAAGATVDRIGLGLSLCLRDGRVSGTPPTTFVAEEAAAAAAVEAAATSGVATATELLSDTVLEMIAGDRVGTGCIRDAVG